MKKYNLVLVLFLCICFVSSINSQTSGIINYQQKVKMSIELDNENGVDISGMLPDSRTVSNDLIFLKNISKYVEGESDFEDQNFSSDDGAIEIVVMTSGIDSELYLDSKLNVMVEQAGFMGKAFLITQEIPKYSWKITTEKVKYLDYECIKATMTNEDEKEVVAWFAPAIPASVGPDGYGQLPGAILMLSIDGENNEYRATKVELKKIDKIKKPKKGKKVTSEEFDKIMDDKMKEMNMQNGGGEVIKIDRG